MINNLEDLGVNRKNKLIKIDKKLILNRKDYGNHVNSLYQEK
jgi:hypothetical protein